jgi:hypothetical protein
MRQMKIAIVVLGCACLCGVALAARGQLTKASQEKGILGYWNPASGTFSPLIQAGPASDASSSVTPTTGKLVFNFTLTVSSTVPKNGQVGCEADANTLESSTGQDITEHVTGIATLSSGTTWTCSLNMPYSWNLSTPSSDTISLHYVISIDDGFEITATNGTATLVAPLVPRSSEQYLPSIKVPASGTTTTETIAATM